MREKAKAKLIEFLRWSEKYTKTDMVYLTSGGFWLVLEQISGILLSLVVAVAFGNLAGKDTYGNYKYVLSLATVLGALSLSGLGEAVGQATARGKDGVLVQAMRFNIFWSGPFFLASLAVSGYYWLLGNMFVAGSLIIVAFLQPIAASGSFFANFLFGQKNFARGAVYVIAENIVTYGAVLAALFIGERAIMIVGAYFLVNAAASLFFSWKAQKYARNTEKDEGLFAFGTHLSVMNILNVIADRFDSIIIFTLLGPAQLATYSFALAAPEQLKGVIKNFYGLALPRFATRPYEEIQHTVWPKIGLLAAVLTTMIGLYIALAPLLFSWLFPVYMDAVVYSQWYALSIIFASATPILTAAFAAHKKITALYVTNNGSSVLLIVSLVVLVPSYGIAGAVGAQVFYRLTMGIIATWQFLRK